VIQRPYTILNMNFNNFNSEKFRQRNDLFAQQTNLDLS